MKKLAIILDETTLINFPFFGSLLSRYKFTVILIPLLSILGAFYLYKSQSTIYRQTARFKNISNETNSPTNSIASLLGESKGGMSASEVVGIPNSTDFQVELANRLMEHESFYKLNFSRKNYDEDYSVKKILSECGEKQDCKNFKVRSMFYGTFRIVNDINVVSSFTLTVTTLDKLTTKVLLDVTSKLIEDSRLKTLKHQIVEQIKVSQSLIDDKEKEFNDYNIDNLRDLKAKYESQSSIINSKIASFDAEFNRLKMSLSFDESRVHESRSMTKNGSLTQKDMQALEEKKDLEEKRDRLEKDISLISDNLSNNETEKLILVQLKNDLISVEAQLKKLNKYNLMRERQVHFVDKSSKAILLNEFDYKVKKGQFLKLKQDKMKLEEERKEVLTALTSVNRKLESIAPSFEYLKLLKQKLVQLKLLESTIISDLMFESKFGSIQVFKQSSKTKFIVFAFVLSFILVAFIVILRYLIDDRVYSEVEIQKRFEGLSIIGHTPEFE